MFRYVRPPFIKFIAGGTPIRRVVFRPVLAIFLACGLGSLAQAQSHWEVKPSNASASLNAVVFGNGLFVAVGDNGTIVTSPNGETWTPRVSGTTDRLPAIAFGNGRFVATRENANTPILTSTDGITWSPASVTNANGAPAQSLAWKGVAFGGGRFMAVGASTSAYADILGSDDGVNFKVIVPAKYPQADALSGRLVGINFFRDRFYALIEDGSFIGSLDGITWKGWISGSVMASNGVTKVASVNSSYNGSTFSVDAGHTFRRAHSPLTKMMAACYGGGRYVAVDYQGRVWTSETDGEYWRPRGRYAQNGEEFRGVAFNGVDRFVAVGSAPASGSALIAVAPVNPPPAPGPGYTVYSLKELSNGAFNGQARAISNNGIIAGSIIDSNKKSVGAIFRDGVVTTYPDPVYHSYQTSVTSVNDNGAAALEVNLGYPFSVGVALPQQSRTFPGGGIYSTAASISPTGWIVGIYRTYDGSTQGIYRYNPNTDERVDLGNFGLKRIEAMSINEWGDIAGRYVYGTGSNGYDLVGPFRLSAGGQLISVPIPRGPYAENIVINSRGDVAGSTDILMQGHAFLFKDGVTTDIDLFDSEGSAVGGMNNKGDVVGSFDAVNTQPWQGFIGNAFLYKDDAMYDLNWLLDASGDGWVLRTATAINDHGWIVGEGYRHAYDREPYLAIPNGGKPAGTQTRFVNVSTRLRTGSGDDALIAGFVLRGGTKRIVVRALGPAMNNWGTPPPNFLADPTLEVFNDRGERIGFNDNYTDLPYYPDRNKVEMVSLVPPSFGSTTPDSVVLLDLPEGSYTAVVRGKNGTSGNCLVEVYNPDTEYTPGLLNISTRGPVGTGDDVMIAGFIIRGDRERRILIRAIGPSLNAFGVANPLMDPVVEIHDSNGTIAQNDSWRSDQETEITAAGFAPGDDREAAVILSLWPGTYTAIVRGKDNSSGNALVEVYALPD